MKKSLAQLTVGVALVLATSFGMAQVANAAVNSATATAPTVTTMAGASCIVTGYTLHAEEEMSKDSISSDQVEDVVYDTCSKAKKQSNGRYKYTNGKITVIAEPSGYVVTVWRN